MVILVHGHEQDKVQD